MAPMWFFHVIDYVNRNKAISFMATLFLASAVFSKYNMIVGKKVVNDSDRPFFVKNAVLSDFYPNRGYFMCLDKKKKIAVFLNDIKMPTNENKPDHKFKMFELENMFRQKLKGSVVSVSGYQPQSYYKGNSDVVVEGEIFLENNVPLSVVISKQGLSLNSK